MRNLLVIALICICAGLVLSNAYLIRTIRFVSTGQTRLERERRGLDRVRLRLSDRVSAFSDRLRSLEEISAKLEGTAGAFAQAGAFVRPVNPDEQEELTPVPAPEPWDEAAGRAQRMWAVPYLSAEEKARLHELRQAMPNLDPAVLLSGDIEALLESGDWNPSGRRLRDEERQELREWVDKYRFYSVDGPQERVFGEIKPRVERLREDGTFVEYSDTEPPPVFDGVLVSHAEQSDTPGLMRIYYFEPDDYPELDRQVRVERERALEAYVNVYQTVNGSP